MNYRNPYPQDSRNGFLANICRPSEAGGRFSETSRSGVRTEGTGRDEGTGFLAEGDVAGDGSGFSREPESFLGPRESGGGIEGLSIWEL